MNAFNLYANHLIQYLQEENPLLIQNKTDFCFLFQNHHQWFSFDLRPLHLTPKDNTAAPFFKSVVSFQDSLDAYQEIRYHLPFEMDVVDPQLIHPFANTFLNEIILKSTPNWPEPFIQWMSCFLSQLDVFTATKCFETFIYDPMIVMLYTIAHQNEWEIHFDHLAIRCGNEDSMSLEQVRNLLIQTHDYRESQISEEQSYQFPDGWSAKPLYKVLTNGIVLRIFLDQSNRGFPQQIIQHWNYVYGFTPHHIALRMTQKTEDLHEAIPLAKVIDALKKLQAETLTPTGNYTHGILEQVFTKPLQVPNIPEDILDLLKKIHHQLPQIIQNGKLIELVSRKEIPKSLLQEYKDLYSLDPHLHPSIPIYHYFLPHQAAHVIDTSVHSPDMQ